MAEQSKVAGSASKAVCMWKEAGILCAHMLQNSSARAACSSMFLTRPSPGQRHCRQCVWGRGEHLIREWGKENQCKKKRQADREQDFQGKEIEEHYFCVTEISRSFFKAVSRTQLRGWTILATNWELGP